MTNFDTCVYIIYVFLGGERRERSDNDGEKGNILTNVSLAEAMKFFS